MKNVKISVEKTKLGVIVPIGNMVDNLQNLSVWLQKCAGLDISIVLVVDSTDVKVQIRVAELVKFLQIPQIQVLHSGNLGPGAARNLGLSKIKCNWVAFWDSDDLSDPSLTLRIIQEHEDSANLICTNYRVFDYEKNRIIKTSNDHSFLDIAFSPGIWRIIFKWDLVQGINFPDLFMAEDQVFISRVLARNLYVVFDSKITYSYFTNFPGQLTTNKVRIRELPKASRLLAIELKSAAGLQGMFISSALTRITLTALTTFNLRTIVTATRIYFSIFMKIDLHFAGLMTAKIISQKVKRIK